MNASAKFKWIADAYFDKSFLSKYYYTHLMKCQPGWLYVTGLNLYNNFLRQNHLDHGLLHLNRIRFIEKAIFTKSYAPNKGISNLQGIVVDQMFSLVNVACDQVNSKQ